MSYEETIMEIAREFPHVDTIQLRVMLDDEVSQCKARGYQRKVEESAALIRLWLKEAEINTDIVRFVASHRRAYIWAAMVRKQMTSTALGAYRDAARRLHGVDGECEIDEGAEVSREEENGAYVQAWVWVADEDLEGE